MPPLVGRSKKLYIHNSFLLLWILSFQTRLRRLIFFFQLDSAPDKMSDISSSVSNCKPVLFYFLFVIAP